MSQIITYLTFNGNCREAMGFYQNCLNGELVVQTLGQTPESDRFPEHYHHLVVQASLKKDNMTLLGTDLYDDKLVKGNTVSILLDGADETHIRKYYERLEEGGAATHPLKETHWGNLFGGLTDKFGNHWLFRCKLKYRMKTTENGK